MKRPRYWPILDIPEGKVGEYKLSHVHYEAGHSFPTSNMRTAMFGGHKGDDVTFDRPVHYHQLTYDGGVWMQDVPIEQAQADPIFKEYRGHVLVGGLGVGYAATRIALKTNVRRVTVVEIAQEVIDLVAQHLPTRARNKMDVVCGDLLEYLNGTTQVFDNGFYDIWQSDGEGTFFTTVVPLLQASPPGKLLRLPDCWNEDVMRGQLVFGLHSSLARLDARLGAISVSLDELCTEKGTIYWDWAVPFFQWYKEHLPADDMLDHALHSYARNYGRPGFDAWWERWVKFFS